MRSFFRVPCRVWTWCVCRYIPALHGVVLAHDHLQFLDKVATIKADCPFMICKVAFDATVWSPQVGIKLGKYTVRPLCNQQY